MHDRPYLKGGAVGMETVATMTRLCYEIHRTVPTQPLGIQILTGDYYCIYVYAYISSMSLNY